MTIVKRRAVRAETAAGIGRQLDVSQTRAAMARQHATQVLPLRVGLE
jgi:hypothetical protein